MPVPLIERFRAVLPVSETTPVVSLGEGSTPLLQAPRLSERYGREIWLKWEGANPTGSYKDRGMTMAVSKGLEEGAQAVVCASTGNTAASAAAYAARAGIPALILTSEGATGEKVAQARMHGARVLAVRGSFDDTLAAARALGEGGNHVLVNSLNPYRREGQKTAVYEIVEQLGGAPDAFVIPYGGGGNTSAYAQALAELSLDALLVSAEAADRRRTIASAIRIGEPAHAERVRSSGALVVTVGDDEILEAWRELAALEGIFCEPSSAAGLAAVRRGDVPGDRLAVTLTGHGLKDVATADRLAPPPLLVEADPDAIRELSEGDFP